MGLGTQVASLFGVLSLDDSDFQRGAKGAAGTMKDLGGGMQDVGKNLTMLGAPFLAFGALALKSFSDSQEQLAQLDSVLRSTGGAAGVTRQQAIDLATAFQQETKFSDEAILSAENLLLTFTNVGKDVFPQATQTILDMSQALGQDTKSSAIQLGKALNNPIDGITALTRVGVTFTDQQKKQIETLVNSGKTMEAQKIILNELSREFGGSAQAAGETFAGQLVILQNRFDDLMETIGMKLMPIAERFIGWIGDAITWFTELNPQIQDVIVGVIAFMGALAIVGPIIAAVGTAIGAIGAIIGVVLSPIGLIIAAVVGLFVAFQNNFLGIRDFLQPVIDSISNFFAHFSDNIKLYGSIALLYFEYYITNPLGDFWNTKLKPAFDLFLGWFQKDGLPFIQNALNDFKDNVLTPVFNFIGDIWNIVSGGLGKLWEWFVKPGGGLDSIKVGLNDFKTNVIDPVVKAIQDIWTKAQPFLDKFKDKITEVFNWVKNNVIQPVINIIDDLIKKLLEVTGNTQIQGQSQGSELSNYLNSGGTIGGAGASQPGFGAPSSGVVPIPPVGGGSGAAPGQGFGANNSTNIGTLNIHANSEAEGAAAYRGFKDAAMAKGY